MERFLEIESTVDNLCRVEEFIDLIFLDFNLSKNVYSRVYLSVIEAVNNAFFHGNQNIISKKVKISFFDDILSFRFIIEDEGLGFDFFLVQDPTYIQNIRKESCRGIFIMKHYADDVCFQNNGSVVKLLFNK